MITPQPAFPCENTDSIPRVAECLSQLSGEKKQSFEKFIKYEHGEEFLRLANLIAIELLVDDE